MNCNESKILLLKLNVNMKNAHICTIVRKIKSERMSKDKNTFREFKYKISRDYIFLLSSLFSA